MGGCLSGQLTMHRPPDPAMRFYMRRPCGCGRDSLLPQSLVPGLRPDWVAFSRAGAPNSPNQCYRPGNVSVSGGNLVLTTKLETCTCNSFDLADAAYSYSSGFVAMRSFNFLYGTVEARIKFGGGASTGSWPFFWMEDATCQASDPSGTDDACTGQEIDIAEFLSSDFTHVNQQIHVDNFTHNDGNSSATSLTDASLNFHVYKLEWTPGQLIWSVDGTPTTTITQAYVPSTPMYLKITNAVGSFGGAVINGSLPWTTLVDYVSVVQGGNRIFFDDFN
jgi:beta-glucanase (GH16 family)